MAPQSRRAAGSAPDARPRTLNDNQRLALRRLADGEATFDAGEYQTFLGIRGLVRRGLAVRVGSEGNRAKWALTEAGAATAAHTSRPIGWESMLGAKALGPYRRPTRYCYRSHVIEVRHEARNRATATVIAPGRRDRVLAQFPGTSPHDCLREARQHVDTLTPRAAR